LATPDSNEPAESTAMVALVCAEQREAWQRGRRPTVEELVARHPALAAEADSLLDLIYNEICLRQEAGHPIDRSQYRDRFPDLASQLDDLLDIHTALAADAWEALTRSGAESLGMDGVAESAAIRPQSASPPFTVGRCATPTALEPGREVLSATLGDLSGERNPSAKPASFSGLVGQRFGGYELIEILAQGGMGVVFKARQVNLDRLIALKMIRGAHFATPQEIERFQAEARAAASLHHPNIVPIHEVDEIEGRHFFTMDLVEGPTLAQLVNERPLAPRRAAIYLARIAEAVQYAHDRGILHRDLKPSNILLDHRDEPHVADFGVAKRLEGELGSTQTHSIVGTPSYMPPEQANRQLGETTPRSDVYSLGAVLYEMLTGRPPFLAAAPLETMLQVLHREVIPPRMLNPSLPRDLETICVKCLEKCPQRRYPTARELGDDLQRFLRDEPIAARPVSTAERWWRRCRGHPLTTGLGATVAALVLLFLVASPIVTLREKSLRRAAEEGQRKAEQQLRVSRAHHLAAKAQAELTEHPQRALLLGVEAVQATLQAGEPAVSAAEQFLRDAIRQVGGFPAPGVAGATRLLQYSPDGRWLAAVADPANTILLWDAAVRPRLAAPQRLTGHRGPITALAFAPGGREMVSVDGTGELLRWCANSASFVLAERVAHGNPLDSIQFSSDGHWLVAAGQASTVWLWHTESPARRPLLLEGHPQRVTRVTFSHDSRWLATVGLDGTIRLWCLTAGNAAAVALPGSPFAGAVNAVQFSPDNGRLAAEIAGKEIDEDATIRVWRLNRERGTCSVVRPPVLSAVSVFAFRPNSTQLAVASPDGTVLLWNSSPDSGTPAPENLGNLPGGVEDLEFSCDGRWLLGVGGYHAGASHEGRQIGVWRLTSAAASSFVTIPSNAITVKVQFAPDSQRLILADGRPDISVWNLAAANWSNHQEALRGHDGAVEQVSPAPGGQWLATSSADGSVRTWELATPYSSRAWRTLDAGSRRVGWARELAEPGRLVFWDEEGAIGVYDPRQPDKACLWQPGDGVVQSVGGSGNGCWLVTGDDRGRVRRWRINSTGRLECQGESPAGSGAIIDVASSHDGSGIVAVTRQRQLQLWRAVAGKLVAVNLPGAADQQIASADLSSDATCVACGCDDGRVRFWSMSNGQVNGLPQIACEHKDPVVAVALTRDGRRIVSVGRGGAIHLRQLRDGPVGTQTVLYRAPDGLAALTLSGDGTRLAIADLQGVVRVWSLAANGPPREPLKLFAPPGCAERLALSRDGRSLLGGGSSKAVRWWRLDRPGDGPILLYGATDAIRQVGFVSHDNGAYAVDSDGDVRLWNLDVNQVLSTAGQIAGRSLSASEREEFSADLTPVGAGARP
jgi:WD40 repeat protein/predicted Ser/Thr protein kinase